MCMTRNINKGHCLVCGCEVKAGEGWRRYVRGRGYRVFCSDHAVDLEHYHGSAALRADRIGSPKKMPLTNQSIGIEIETDTNRTDDDYLRFRGTLERVGTCLKATALFVAGKHLPRKCTDSRIFPRCCRITRICSTYSRKRLGRTSTPTRARYELSV